MAQGNGTSSFTQESPGIQFGAETIAESRKAPQVTAVLVIADKRRMKVARTAVNQFLLQSYQNKRIMIVNSTDVKLTNREHEWVQEIMVNPLHYSTVGAMRNHGISLASGDWIMPLDDDDHSHPHRLTFQMAHRQPGTCSMLSHQVRADVLPNGGQNMICVVQNPAGIPSTIIFPRGKATYDETLQSGEDVELVRRCFGDLRVVLDNNFSWFPGAALSIAFWHGLNVLTRESFLGKFAVPEYVGRRPDGLTEDQLDYVTHALSLYGYTLQIRNAVVGPANNIL